MVLKADINQTVSQAINEQLDSLAEKILMRQLEVQPRPALCFDIERREWGLTDIRNHLILLADAIHQSNPSLFSHYVKWAQELLEQTNQPIEDLNEALRVVRDVLEGVLPKEMREVIHKFLDSNQEPELSFPVDTTSFVNDSVPFGSLAHMYLEVLINGNKEEAIQLILDAVEDEHVNV